MIHSKRLLVSLITMTPVLLSSMLFTWEYQDWNYSSWTINHSSCEFEYVLFSDHCPVDILRSRMSEPPLVAWLVIILIVKLSILMAIFYLCKKRADAGRPYFTVKWIKTNPVVEEVIHYQAFEWRASRFWSTLTGSWSFFVLSHCVTFLARFPLSRMFSRWAF